MLTNSTRWIIVLILKLTLMENEMISTDDTVTYSFQNLFSEADQCKQKVIEQGSTLTLTCLAIKLESYENLFFMDVGGQDVTIARLTIISTPSDSIVIPLKITHPDVRISVSPATEQRFENELMLRKS